MAFFPSIRLYLDTADTTQWQAWLPTGIFYGITCNPLLLERADVACTVSTLRELTLQAEQMGVREVHLQAWGESVESLVQVGRALGQISSRVVVKLPATQNGTTAASVLIQQHNIPVTLTAVYAVHQVLIAAAIGASYAAPYLGRINDSGRDGRAELTAMQQALDGVGSPMRLLSASIRQVEDISVLAAQGIDTFTFSPAIAQSLFSVPETLSATADFARAATKMA
ncbi:MAG: transaldolase family protein [Cyanobacteria bacterium P01_D01_bin.105]